MISMTCWRAGTKRVSVSQAKFSASRAKFSASQAKFSASQAKFSFRKRNFRVASQAISPKHFAARAVSRLDVGDLASDDANLLCVQALDTRGYPLFRPTAGL
jgi:hypothetical protein